MNKPTVDLENSIYVVVSNLGAQSISHEIKSSIGRYEGYGPIIFKAGQAYTPKARPKKAFVYLEMT